MAVGLAVSTQAPTSQSARKRAVNRAVKEVAEYLGNTPAVCRSSYIDPRVIDLYDDGVTIAASLERLGADADFGQPATHGMVEAAVLRLLRKPPKAAGRRRSARVRQGRLTGLSPARRAAPTATPRPGRAPPGRPGRCRRRARPATAVSVRAVAAPGHDPDRATRHRHPAAQRRCCPSPARARSRAAGRDRSSARRIDGPASGARSTVSSCRSSSHWACTTSVQRSAPVAGEQRPLGGHQPALAVVTGRGDHPLPRLERQRRTHVVGQALGASEPHAERGYVPTARGQVPR